jgi:hypothetical protein
MFKSLGFAAITAGLLLGFSPRAREIARRYAVIATEAILDITDQIRSSSTRIAEQLKMENENR